MNKGKVFILSSVLAQMFHYVGHIHVCNGIIKHTVALSKYGHSALDIHPRYRTDTLQYT